MSAPETLPVFARGLCDDAAMFPPGLAPLEQAVPAHRAHRASRYRDLVGPLVLAAPALTELGPLLGQAETEPLELAVTAPAGPAQLRSALEHTRESPVRLRAVEIAVPEDMPVPKFRTELDRVRAIAPETGVYVEIPRDARRADVIAACADHGHRAKFRTGGVRADLYPDETELAAALSAVVSAAVPFKATAGLHHAVRNTDPETGFEQHGFLNLLLATDAALSGADEAVLATLLAERDGTTISRAVGDLDTERAAAARAAFVSFGTCSITEPLTELVDLRLVAESVLSGEGATT